MNKRILDIVMLVALLLGPLCSVTFSQAGANINPSLKILETSTGVNPNDATITFGAAQALVSSEFPTQALDRSFYCMIHVLKWKGGNTDKPIIEVQNWYTYNMREKDRFQGVRIFGSRNVGFLYIHLNVPGAPAVPTERQQQLLSDRFLTSNLDRQAIGVSGGLALRQYTKFNYTWEEKAKLPELVSDAGAIFNLVTQSRTTHPLWRKPRATSIAI